ncbi:hypothetical protein GCM10012287_57070 [Streptomyces daqingensis]|uniref:Uncharacterized protein n=1 Tax=Streptomyces daqingensis TaxID=1472640 RepID=A0ABQ2MVD0_9ACTN|nr:DUF5994 family protein [Streptomyces daqingensis]GGO58587.1 hypothetical protein GCM10012287_57070 [Streptomyces daqingensis]
MGIAGNLLLPYRASGLPVRLALLPAGTAPHWCDGTWWPRSHDLGRELPSLVTALEASWPGITQVKVSCTMWRIHPETVAIGDRTVHIERCDVPPKPHTICLRSDENRCDLLVTPPDPAGRGGTRSRGTAVEPRRGVGW